MMTLTDYLHTHYSPATAALYERHLASWLAYMPEAETATHADITGFFGHLRKRYTNPGTLNIYLYSIKAWYNWLQKSGVREDNPARSIVLKDKTPKEIRLQNLLSTTELQQLYKENAHTRDHYLSIRNRALMSLLSCQALLPAELEALQATAPDLTGGTIRIEGTPQTNSRELPLASTQILLLHDYLTIVRPVLNKHKISHLLLSRNGRPLQGEDLTKQVIRHGRKLLPGRQVNARLIRQSVIAEKLKRGGDTRIVQVFAGHKCPSTTEKYKQDSLEQLRAGILKYHPEG